MNRPAAHDATEVARASTTGTTRAVVTCERVGRTFGTGEAAVVAVHDVTCRVSACARIAVSGRSGSGKSTLLQLLAGLDRPTLGSIDWPALDVARRLPGGTWEPDQVGVVFQNESLVPALTGLENVALPLLIAGMPLEDAERAAHAALERLGLEPVGRRLPDELSGGQAQRLAVARVLASRPRLILADEPTGRLDHALAATVIDALLETADAIGAALVVATHDARVIERFDVRWRMTDGALEPKQLPGTHPSGTVADHPSPSGAGTPGTEATS
jgi:putative ABC transport system ATP-binding protein